MPLEPTQTGLLARAGEYEPLRAFSQGGRYWDRVPQQLIREGGLAEFLPPVEVEEDDAGKYGRFHHDKGRRELLCRSKPLGRRAVPAAQLQRLRQALEGFRLKANTQGAQPQNRELIERFRLPDIAQDAELYRLAGPWWDRHLQILWGCERTVGSSLPAGVAVGKLQAARFYGLRRALLALLLLLLLLAPAWWLCQTASRFLGRSPGQANQAEADRKATEAGKAQAAADKAQHDAHRAQAAAEKAKADAAAAKNAALQAKAASDAARQAPKDTAVSLPLPGLPSNSIPLPAPGASAPAATDGRVAYEIVLSAQGQPEADGTVNVTLEVRADANPPHAVPVETWRVENQSLSSQDRLQVRMKPGNHAVRAVVRDPAGKPSEISATVTVEPGRVITVPGKVSVRPR